MADLVLGIGSSHAPQLRMTADQWPLLLHKDTNDPRYNYQEVLSRAKPDMEAEITPEVMEKRYAANHVALGKLRDKLAEVAPDALVIVGDDQHEQFWEDNMPMFSVYRGAEVTVKHRHHATTQPKSEATAWLTAGERAEEGDYPAAPDLAEQLIETLVDRGFDIAASNKLRDDVGVGHAFEFVYQYIMPKADIPIVPVSVNTYFPPNQPTARRSYQLGGALREAIEAWDVGKRVAIMASGGLSHFIIDEEIDRAALDAMKNKDVETLVTLPKDRLMVLGTTEILNWITVAGAMEPEEMTVLDYVPCYRTPAGTGCAMAFATWE